VPPWLRTLGAAVGARQGSPANCGWLPVKPLGPGEIALLEHIERRGSLSHAARELHMSNRRA